MNVFSLLAEAADACPDRLAVTSDRSRLTFGELMRASLATAQLFHSRDAEHAVLIDVNSLAVPITLFAAAAAGVPYVPLNYRKTNFELDALVRRAVPALLVGSEAALTRIQASDAVQVLTRDKLLRRAASDSPGMLEPHQDGDRIAVQLFTSGTTGAPKAALLRHNHLMAYVRSMSDFASANEDEANLITAPPYHISAIVAVLMSARSCRRTVMMESFEPRAWLDMCVVERITHGFVVPTMLSRILDEIRGNPGRWDMSALRSIRYGGGKMPLSLITKAMDLLPKVDFTNTYGMTEASSTICMLSPNDHRAAAASRDPTIRKRLESVGQAIATVDIEVRDDCGNKQPPDVVGQIFARGAQVAGEYLDTGSQLDSEGWFWTQDRGYLDRAGYLFLDGRSDDVIVRGGENISPGEIEDVLLTHPAVSEVAVVAIPNEEWGEAIAAIIVPTSDAKPTTDELRAWVKQRLRSSREPAYIEFRKALPINDMGKVLRRVLRDELVACLEPPA